MKLFLLEKLFFSDEHRVFTLFRVNLFISCLCLKRSLPPEKISSHPTQPSHIGLTSSHPEMQESMRNLFRSFLSGKNMKIFSGKNGENFFGENIRNLFRAGFLGKI